MKQEVSKVDYECLDSSNTVKHKTLTIHTCLSYISQLKDPMKILNDERAFVAFRCIRDRCGRFDYVLLTRDYPHVAQVYVDCLNVYKNDIKVYLLSNRSLQKQNETQGIHRICSTQFYILFFIMPVIWNTCNTNPTFRNMFHELGGTKCLLEYLSDDELVEACKHLKFDDDDDDNHSKKMNGIVQPGVYLLRSMIGSINNISKNADSIRDNLKAYKATQILMNFFERIKDLPTHRLSCCMALANILCDNEIDSLPNTSSLIDELVNLIEKCGELIGLKNDKYRRAIGLEDGQKVKICIIEMNGVCYHLVELILALYRIGVNDRSKLLIYNKLQVKSCFDQIITHGLESEVEYTLKLLWQLCFDREVLEKLIQNTQLFEYIIDLPNKANYSSVKITNYIDGIKWLRNDHNADKQVSKCEQDKRHIMISYNRESRDLCLKIKEFLEKSVNVKVWIDVNDISGSSLESMANAIESSKCVLVCMSEKYKQSSYCRAEAEYAFRLNTIIIPLIMQKNYQPDGWLGILLGSKIFIDFTKYSFDECTHKLLKELNNVAIRSTNEPFKKVQVSRTFGMEHGIASNNHLTINWSTDQVKNWLETLNFNSSLFDGYTGEMLNKLAQMQRTAPQFFYTTMAEKFAKDLKQIICFSLALDKLFL